MWPCTEAFDNAIHRTHQVVILAELWTSGQAELVDPSLAVIGGTVTVDRTASVRRTGTIQIADDGDMFPSVGQAGTSGLEPYGNEVVLSRGVQYPDGSQEVAPLGVFAISDTNLSESSSGRSVTLTLVDRSALVSENKFVATYTIAKGTAFVAAIQALVDFALPYNVSVDRDVEATTPTTTGAAIVYHEQDDPWKACGELAASVGLEVFFGPTGRLQLRDIPDPLTGDPDALYLDDELSILLGVDRKLTRAPNAVLVTTSASSVTPVRSLKYDDNIQSPTYYWGPYGQLTDFHADPLITSQAQADVAAAGRLRKILGLAESVSLSIIPHPAHEAGDIIHAMRAADGLDADFLLEQITIPLDAVTAATITGRMRIPPP